MDKELGKCDFCNITYDVGSQIDHCGNCGTCDTHCKCKTLKVNDKIIHEGISVTITLIGEPQENYQIWEGVTDSGGPIWGYVWKENLKSVEKEKRTRV
jgi:hypothetical protein